MAIYHFQTKSVSRGAGRSAVAAAAYRAGERIRDERTGVLHNYSRRTDVVHKEILLPSQYRGGEMDWIGDRSSLWNTAENVEQRRNARVAREYQVALPAELSAIQRLNLAREFSQELANRHNVAVDLAVHDPKPEGDPRNYHAHLLVTSREILPNGFGAKAGLDMSWSERQRRGLAAGLEELKTLRERWATLGNEALRAAGLKESIDHRSLRVQGIDREPRPHIPYAAVQIERRGERSEVAERIRERYRVRIQARQARTAEPSGMDDQRPKAGQSQRLSSQLPTSQERWQPSVLTLEQIRLAACEAWLKMRSETAQKPEIASAPALAVDASKDQALAERNTAENDYSL